MKTKLIVAIVVLVVGAAYIKNYIDDKNQSNFMNQIYNRQNQIQQTQQFQQVPGVQAAPVAPPGIGTNSGNTQVQRRICPTCHGSGSCPICRGRGYYSNYGFTSPCNGCDDYRDSVDSEGRRLGNGVCSSCHGERFIQ